MRARKLTTFLFILFPWILYSQGFQNGHDDFKILISGKSKVNVFVNNKLSSVWFVDSLNKRIGKYQLGTKNIANYPKFDSVHFVKSYSLLFFNRYGLVDSILTIDYENNQILVAPNKVDNYPDTSVYIYDYPQYDKIAVNMKHYRIENGIRIRLKTTIFTYNSKKQLLSKIEDEGNLQSTFSYNISGQVEKETVLWISQGKIYFFSKDYSYDGLGNPLSIISESQSIYYEYFENALLRKMETFEGKSGTKCTFEYE